MAAARAAALTDEERFSRTTSDYTAKDIRVLEGIQAIQLRPAMYIGSTSTSGLVHLIWEALDNAVDEAVAGYGAQIWVDIDRDGVARVLDEGRGMPFDLMTYQGKRLPSATVLLTVPHSGGKFGEGAYKTAGGLHGVGATVINALSEWLELDIWRDGQHFSQRFERGKPLPPKIVPGDSKKHATQLRWRYDRQIFDHDAYYPRETLERRFKAALTRVANDYAARMGVIKNRDKEALKPEVIQQGLVAAISVKLKDPQFEGQTKTKLNNAPVEGIVRSVVIEGLKEWFDARPAQARDWLKKIQDDQKLANRLAAEEQLARTGQKRAETVDLDTSKFSRASTTDPDRAELFIVEGQSAGGNAKQGRDASYQAILALRGKPINVINARPERLQLNKEYALLASVIGTGVRGAFSLEKCRYDKIIVMTDADVDGGHIRALLLALFYQEMPGLIQGGKVFVAMPPLYSVKYKGKTTWLTDDEALRRFTGRNPDATNAPIKRYKGLGEMTASELRETTMHPATRVLKQVTLEDSAIAAQVVADLMDESRPEARREFLAQAARLTDLDV